MTAEHDEREDRLAELTEALRERPNEPTADEVRTLAERFALTPEEVNACHRAVAALRRATAPALPPSIDPGVLPDTYEVLGELGRGGMGVVYRARHSALGRDVAIKVLQTGEQMFQEMLRRFEVEARSLARLRHPHIVAVHDVGRSQGHVYYTMDLIEGSSLERVLQDAGGPDRTLSPSRAVRILQQVTSAIEHSHEHGVIHRDLKPANILLDRNDTAFVADFGLARDRTVDVGLTTTGQIMGTPTYMSPEAMRGDHAVIGERSDVWALGAILYQMLCGKSPFTRQNLADTMQAVLHEEPVPLRRRNPRVPRDLELVCHKALAKSPEERYATARALREDLDRFQQGLPVLAQRPSLRRRLLRFAARNRGAVLGAVLTAGAVAAAMLLLQPAPDSPQVIDAMIRTANEREAQRDFAGAAESYEHARGVLGRDAHRPMRHASGATSDPLIDQVWRGLLRCQAELAWQRVARGEYSEAAADFRAWMQRRPAEAETWLLAESNGELSALQALAGDVPAAMATLETTAHPAPAWSAVRRRLQVIWDQPNHPRWRAAGGLLALAVAGTQRTGLAARLDGVDSSTALVGAWSHAESVPPPARDRLRARVRAAVFGADTPLQWGCPNRDTLRALATLTADRNLASATRLEALDLLCAAADLPWRPPVADAISLDSPRGQRAIDLATATVQLPRPDAWRQRIDLAIELLADGGDQEALRQWLGGTTGMAPATDFAAWWSAHKRDDLTAHLGTALGDEARHEPGAAMAARFQRLTGLQRRRYHVWLCLRGLEGTPTPLWPAFEPEPDNLVATWQLGVRQPGEQTTLRFQFAQWGADGRSQVHGSDESRTITLDEPLRTWFGYTTSSLAESLLPDQAFVHRQPELATCLPGIDDANHPIDLPSRRVSLDARLLTQDHVRVSWSATLDNQPGFHLELRQSAPQPLGTLGLHVVDGWYGGYEGETAGPCLLAIGAWASTSGGDGLPAWDEVCSSVVDGAALAGNDGVIARAARLGIGVGTADAAAAFDVVAKIPLARTIAELVPKLRTADAAARTLRGDPAAMAVLLDLAANTTGADAGTTLRGRLAAPLAARMVNGDGTALGEPAFAERLAEAEAGLGLGPWWWYRVLVSAREVGDAVTLGELAARRLAAMELPAPLLLTIAKSALTSSLPTELSAQVARFEAARWQRRWTNLLPIAGLLAIAFLAAVWGSIRLIRRRHSVVAPTALLATTGLGLYLIDVRFGTLRLPPAAVGLGLVALASMLLFWQRRGPVAVIAVVATTLAALAGFAADDRWHPFASAIAGIASAFALAVLALQFKTAARLPRLTWLPALLLAAAGTVGGLLGVEVLTSGREVDSFRAAVETSSWTGLGRGLSAVGSALLLGMLTLVAVRTRSEAEARPAPRGAAPHA